MALPVSERSKHTMHLVGMLIISVQPSPPRIPRRDRKTCVALPGPCVGPVEVVDAVKEDAEEDQDDEPDAEDFEDAFVRWVHG